MSISKKAQKAIARLPMAAEDKFALMRNIKYAKQCVRKALGKEYKERAEFTLIPQNVCYGHEHEMKKYCGYEDDIYAVIEHGIFWGDVILGSYPFPQEAEIGSFLTFGEYRRKLLQDFYPDKQIIPVGPYVRYATPDYDFLHMLEQKQKHPGERTLTLFPAHSIAECQRAYDHLELAKNALDVARQHDAPNIFVCLHPFDYTKEKIALYSDLEIIPISCGGSGAAFLSRQRAIFELSDLTISNDLGTHTGYSIALEVPHRIIEPLPGPAIEDDLKDLNVETLKRQYNDFCELFRYSKDIETTQDQYDIVNYYWGLDSFRTPEELNEILHQCKKYYFQH